MKNGYNSVYMCRGWEWFRWDNIRKCEYLSCGCFSMDDFHLSRGWRILLIFLWVIFCGFRFIFTNYSSIRISSRLYLFTWHKRKMWFLWSQISAFVHLIVKDIIISRTIAAQYFKNYDCVKSKKIKGKRSPSEFVLQVYDGYLRMKIELKTAQIMEISLPTNADKLCGKNWLPDIFQCCCIEYDSGFYGFAILRRLFFSIKRAPIFGLS